MQEQTGAAGAPAAAAAPASPAAASVRLLFLLDITGSMSQEIEACKGAMQGLVSMCTTDLQNYAGQISFAVITFTEDNKAGCFTSLFESTSAEEAQAYMNRIQLSTPPEAPHIKACGDDGPENHKAALARTTELDPSVPTIAFLITDAEPHINLGTTNNGISRTAKHELQYLATRYPSLTASDARDVFKTFRQTALAHFGESLILNCVVYNTQGRNFTTPCQTQLLLGGLAQQTGGMLMQPNSRDADALAAGLVSVVQALMARLMGQPSDQQQQEEDSGVGTSLEGFRLIDLSGVPDRSSEAEPAGEVSYGDTDALFKIAMERMVAVCGKKWSKRAIGMSAPAEQLQFVWRAARYISLCAKPAPSDSTAVDQLTQAKADELLTLLALRATVIEALPADQKGHFSISEAVLKQLGQEAAEWAVADSASAAGAGAAISAISLATVGEALEDDAVWEDWLHSVMKLLLGYPIHISLPLDAYGQPDFMDAWSAVLLRMGVDTISAAEFMQLIQDKSTATGLTDKRKYNAFLVMPAQGDKLAELVFRVASSTQVLDYVTAVVMGGKGFLPNLHAGITAACLTRLLTAPTALSDFQWSQVQQLAHTLCIRHTNAAKSITEQLLKGAGNPEDHPSRFVLALLRLHYKQAAVSSACRSDLGAGEADSNTDGAAADAESPAQQLQAVLGLVLREWLGAMMQCHYGKQTPENNEKYLKSVLRYIPLEAVFGASTGAASEFDPLQQMHPLESLNPDKLGGSEALPEGIRPDWQTAVLQRMAGAVPGTPAHPMLVQFVLGAGRLLALLLPPGSPAATAAQGTIKASTTTYADSTSDALPVAQQLPGAVAALDSCWPNWRETALQAMLLRFRTARYACKTSEESSTDSKGGPLPETAAVAAGKVVWEAVAVRSSLALAVERLQEALSAQLRGYKQARIEAAKQQLLKATAALLVKHAADPDAACEQLQKLKLQIPARGDAVHAGNKQRLAAADFEGGNSNSSSGPSASLLDVTFTLQRIDVPAVLEALGASMGPAQMEPSTPAQDAPADTATAGAASTGSVTAGLLRMLVLGPWSTQGAQVFRRSLLVQQLCQVLGCADLQAAICAQEVCRREEGHNRHGHSASMPFPGPDGWTEEYAAARLAAAADMYPHQRIRVQSTVAAMQKFTAMAAWAREAAKGDAGKFAAVVVELADVQDAKRYPQVLLKLQEIVGQEMPVV